MRYRLTLASLCVILLNGCAVHQAQIDQDRIRYALLDMYTNQIIDNLVRARKGLPIIQLDYTQAQGMVTMKQTGSISDGQTVTKSSVMALPAMTQTVTRTIATTLMGSLGFERTNQITLAATPVVTSNEVYDAYIEFLTIPGSLVITPEPPPPCAAVISKKCDGVYYWVPDQFRGDFFNLSLRTTAQRGKPLLPSPDFFTVNATRILDQKPLKINPDYSNVTVKLDQKIPNDDGFVMFTSPSGSDSQSNNAEPVPPGQQIAVPERLPPLPAPSNDKKPKPLQARYPLGIVASSNQKVMPILTGEISITMSGDDVQALQDQLDQLQQRVPVKVFLSHRRPPAPTTEELLQRANFQLQQLNQNVVREGGF